MAKRRKPDLELSIETITPAIAEKMLASNIRNRSVSERLVDVYTETILAGEWRLNGEPIIFDWDSNLQSGQHRLLAVIESGASIETVVVRGAEPDAIYSLDSGRKRRIMDVLQLRGETDVTNLGAALSWVWRMKTNHMDRSGETTTNTHLLKILDETPEIRDSIIWGRRVRNQLKLSAGLITALHWATDRIDPEISEAFWEGVISGEGLKAGDPRLVLRRWAIHTSHDARRPSQQMVAAVCIKAWNAYREVRVIRILSYKANEEFPKLV